LGPATSGVRIAFDGDEGLFSNWQVAGIISAMSGLPIDIIDGGSGSFYGLSGGNNAFMRPSWAPGVTAADAKRNVPAGYFFNPSVFVRPTVLPGQVIPSSNGLATASATGTDFGNVGRNVLRGPNQVNVDFSVIKRFPIRESKNIELRAEFFNLLQPREPCKSDKQSQRCPGNLD
jgi:hypothetical protein